MLESTHQNQRMMLAYCRVQGRSMSCRVHAAHAGHCDGRLAARCPHDPERRRSWPPGDRRGGSQQTMPRHPLYTAGWPPRVTESAKGEQQPSGGGKASPALPCHVPNRPYHKATRVRAMRRGGGRRLTPASPPAYGRRPASSRPRRSPSTRRARSHPAGCPRSRFRRHTRARRGAGR